MFSFGLAMIQHNRWCAAALISVHRRTKSKQFYIGNSPPLLLFVGSSSQSINRFNFFRFDTFSTEVNASAATKRRSSSNLSLETAIYQEPDIVKSHLKSRSYVDIFIDKKSTNELGAIDKLLDLREKRNNLIKKGNLLRNQKKNLSGSIGKLMKDTTTSDAVAELKKQVESLTLEGVALDEQLSEIENSAKNIQMVIPNLLDDR